MTLKKMFQFAKQICKIENCKIFQEILLYGNFIFVGSGDENKVYKCHQFFQHFILLKLLYILNESHRIIPIKISSNYYFKYIYFLKIIESENLVITQTLENCPPQTLVKICVFNVFLYFKAKKTRKKEKFDAKSCKKWGF